MNQKLPLHYYSTTRVLRTRTAMDSGRIVCPSFRGRQVASCTATTIRDKNNTKSVPNMRTLCTPNIWRRWARAAASAASNTRGGRKSAGEGTEHADALWRSCVMLRCCSRCNAEDASLASSRLHLPCNNNSGAPARSTLQVPGRRPSNLAREGVGRRGKRVVTFSAPEQSLVTPSAQSNCSAIARWTQHGNSCGRSEMELVY